VYGGSEVAGRPIAGERGELVSFGRVEGLGRRTKVGNGWGRGEELRWLLEPGAEGGGVV